MKFLWPALCLLSAAYVACAEEENSTLQRDTQVVDYEGLLSRATTMSGNIEKEIQKIENLNKKIDEIKKSFVDCENLQGRSNANDQKIKKTEKDNPASRETELMERLIQTQITHNNLLRQSFSYNQEWLTILDHYDGNDRYNHDFYYNPDFFNGSWAEYKRGFDYNRNAFIGLHKLHQLTTYEGDYELIIVLTDFADQKRYAKYDLFRIGGEAEKYAITELGVYSGDAGDALRPHKGQRFSTYDEDNDGNDDMNCASVYGGGWWFFGDCKMSLLTGSNNGGSKWSTWGGWEHSLISVIMKIRPTLKHVV